MATTLPNGLTNRVSALTAEPWEGDLLDMAQALRADILEKIPALVKESVEGEVQDDIMDAMRGTRSSLKEMVESRLIGVCQAVDGLQGKVEEVANKLLCLEKSLLALAGLEARVAALPEIIEGLLGNLPIPQINVDLPEMQVANHFSAPTDSIRLQVDSPDVVVHVPQQEAPVVHIDNHTTSPDIHVDVQPTPVTIENKMDAPKVEVNIPEQQAPTVNVEVPRRKTSKSIEYDEQSRPIRITEEEMYDVNTGE